MRKRTHQSCKVELGCKCVDETLLIRGLSKHLHKQSRCVHVFEDPPYECVCGRDVHIRTCEVDER